MQHSLRSDSVNLHDAARAGDLPQIEALLKDRPDLVFSEERAGGTPLHCAAKNGHKDVAEPLLASRADVDAKNRFGETPLLEAARNGQRDLAELLLANQVDVNVKDNDGATPLHWAKDGHKDVAGLLLASKADVDAKESKYGRTPLDVAATGGQKDVAELLRRHHARLSASPRGENQEPIAPSRRSVF
jgi:ankyrin repeat protein